MKLGVRSKLFLVSVVLILSAGIPVGAYLETQLRGWMEGRIEVELIRHAGAARDLIQVAPDIDSIDAADGLADTMGQTISARLTLVAADGTVIGDSQVDATAIGDMENHGLRPEIVAANQQSPGMSRRYSTTLHTDMLYVAVPFQRSDTSGTVRVAVALDEVDSAVGRLRVILLLAGLLGLGVALLMSGLASHLSSRTLRLLVQNARAMAAGNRKHPIAIRSDDEIGGIAVSLNRMAEELEGTVAVLAAERDRMEAVLEGMAAAVVALDERHIITLVNASARTLFSEPAEPIGRTLSELVRAPALSELVEDVANGKSAEREFDLIGPKPRRLLAHATPQRTTGGAVIVLHDVTRIRHLETVRRDFVANVSHELRTPVTVIRANAETLLGGAQADPDRATGFLEAILRNAERLSHIIADLLDLSRIEAGHVDLDIASSALAPIVHRAIEESAGLNAFSLEVEVAPEVVVAADSQALVQILLNLLDNARKYTPAGGRIVIDAERVESMVRVAVRDDGPGIEPRHRDRIFERFYRVDPGRARDLGGTGLGLSIVKHLVEAMGGTVGVEPGTPGGSVFWFTLPVAD